MQAGADTEGFNAREERWALVQRVVHSAHFRRAPQLREFLCYVASRAIADETGQISEYKIGCQVLGRRAEFNPAEDNIVRVQARHLRQKLEEYFADEGQAEPVIITIPKGGYVPRFEPRPDAAARAPAKALPAALRSRWIAPVAAAGLVLLLAAPAILFWKRAPASAADSLRDNPLLSRVFVKGQQTHIVVSDASLSALQDILGTDIPLNDYLSRDYPGIVLERAGSQAVRTALEVLTRREYTNLGDLNAAARLLQWSAASGAKVSIQYARHLNIRDFKNENFIVIGNRRNNPWVQLFEQPLNFYYRRDAEAGRYVLENRAPRASEQAAYFTTELADRRESYADLALVPNLSGSGTVLLLNGLAISAVEATGELLVSRDFGALAGNALGPAHADGTRFCELLVRVKIVGNAPRQADIIASRSFAAPGPSGRSN